MNGILYSHRLKSSLQQMVRDLGLTLVLDDSRSDLKLSENMDMIQETAQLLGVKLHVEEHEAGLAVTFYK